MEDTFITDTIEEIIEKINKIAKTKILFPVFCIVFILLIVASLLWENSFIAESLSIVANDLFLIVFLISVVIRLKIPVVLTEFFKELERNFFWNKEQVQLPMVLKRLECWICVLGILVIVAFFYIRHYRKEYCFKTETFYYIPGTNVYHDPYFFNEDTDCDVYIKETFGVEGDAEQIKGSEILKKGFELCPVCDEKISDAEMDANDARFSRR